MRKLAIPLVMALLVVGGAAVACGPIEAPAAVTAIDKSPARPACDARATDVSTLDTQVSEAVAGQTICLVAGDYGIWTGTDKTITILAEPGANMTIDLDSDAAGFTLDGLSGMGGVAAGAHHFTIRNSTFAHPLRIQGSPPANILIEGNRFDWNPHDEGDANAKLFLWTAEYGQASGIVVRGNSFRNGDLDGIHIGNGAGGDIIGNTFENFCFQGSNHTDMLQTEGMVGGRIAQNLFKAGANCSAQALTSFDSGTVGVIVEDNVIDIRRPWGIEWYSDKDSIIRNNTVAYYPDAECFFNTRCGRINISSKSEDPQGSGTQVIDNLAVVEFNGGSTGVSSGNISPEGAVFVGPLDTWSGYKLAPGSRGKGAGARIP